MLLEPNDEVDQKWEDFIDERVSEHLTDTLITVLDDLGLFDKVEEGLKEEILKQIEAEYADTPIDYVSPGAEQWH